ncbi:HNH endonuclease [Escherichia coli]|nr:HNH endonuclease [Escherichia coli]
MQRRLKCRNAGLSRCEVRRFWFSGVFACCLKAHGGTDADSNLQSLCWPCHKAKTARERLK